MTANELDDEYRRNDYNNALVSALNAVSEDERDLIIVYIANNRKTSRTARYLRQPRHIVHQRLMQARQHIIKEYEKILNSEDECDYRIDWLKRHETKPERPIIQANLFDWTPIAKYASLEQAANAVSGNPERIMNVCNNHSFKYKNSRWFWLDDWNNIKNKNK